MRVHQAVFRGIAFVGTLTIAACIALAQDKAPSTVPAEHDMHVGPIRNPPQSAPSFTLKLSAKAEEYRIGSKVVVTIVRTNITDHTIDDSGYYGDVGNRSYSYDVRDEDGKPLEKSSDYCPSVGDSPRAFAGAYDNYPRHSGW
jgi:hypothetical protein